ncbi:gfo/Idh/MocA family oxidoreductase [Actinobacteria bacterium YIM 96077]|nr:gfo/Idh/MocA family oxidoreductase [Actinobacteria bacterium YIM 96077]
MSDPVRWGVLGCAAIALNKVIPAMQEAENCEVLAIASRDGDRAAEAAAKLGISRSYGSYEALLADPEIEAVYIPLPNNLHKEWTLHAAHAGKHVLCEKPLAMSSAEAATMLVGCEQAGVALMEAFMYRLHPSWVRARELVAEGRIGELRAIEAVFAYNNRMLCEQLRC